MSSAKRGHSNDFGEESQNGRSEFPYSAGNNHFDSPHETDCSYCQGSRKDPRDHHKDCPKCGGKGKELIKN